MTIQTRLLGAALTLTGGVILGVAYENYAPWALGPRLERLQESLPGRDRERYSAGAEAQRALDEAVVQARWAPALAECTRQREEMSETTAQRMAEERGAAERSRSAAYRLGKVSCGADNEKNDPSGVDRHSTGIVQPGEDLRSIVSGSLNPTP